MVMPGETAQVEATFYNNGLPIDPVSVQVQVRAPSTVIVAGPYTYPAATITRMSEGRFVFAWVVPGETPPGEYEVDWTAVVVPGDDPATATDTVDVVLAEGVPGAGDPYCTRAEARAAGAIGTDDTVDQAIAQAVARVDTFTADYFTPRARTVVTRVGGDGRAMLPYRLTAANSVVAVVDHDQGTTYPTGTYRAYTSADDGDVDAVGIGRSWVGTNILIHGLEPWAEHRDYTGVRLRVTATFGWPTPPALVRQATAVLAAALSAQIRADDDNDPETPNPETSATTDPEGNVVPVVPPFPGEDEAQQAAEDVAAGRRTTGVRAVDALLDAYRRQVLFSAV